MSTDVTTSPFAPFFEQSKLLIEQETNEANTFAQQLKTAGNAQALVHEFRDDAETSDEKILAYREYVAKMDSAILDAQSKIEQYIISANLVNTDPIDVEAVTESYKAKASQVKALRKALEGLPGGSDILESITPLIPVANVRTNSGSATGVRRPRIARILLDGEEIMNKEGKTTISMLAQKLGIDGSDLRNEMYNVAGTEDLASLNGKPIEFTKSIGDIHHEIKIVPATKS